MLAAHRSDPEIARYVHWTPPYTTDQARELIERTPWRDGMKAGDGAMIAVERDGVVVGDCAFQLLAGDVRQASIGFTVHRPHQGHGYATEAVRGLLRHLFTRLRLHRVVAECGADNLASSRVLERVGMRREAHFIENVFFKGAWASEYHYAMLEREWPG
jgi:aminoglycoside 6'-N-acetyltransferase